MYDLYPEWGPARHRADEEEHPTRRARYWQPQPMQQQLARAGAPTGAPTGAPEARDAEGDRPDDN